MNIQQAARFTQGRKRQSLSARTKRCKCCEFPLSERHHLLPFRHYGEHITTSIAHFCPTCHSIFHLFFDGAHSKRSVTTINCLVTEALVSQHTGNRSLSNRLTGLLRSAVIARRTEVDLCTQILAVATDPEIISYYEQTKHDALLSLNWLNDVESSLGDAGITHPSPLEMVLGGVW